MDVDQRAGICIWKCKHSIDRRFCHSCFYTQEFDRLVEAHQKSLLQRYGRKFDVSSRNKRHNDAADSPNLSDAESKQRRLIEFNDLAPNSAQSQLQSQLQSNYYSNIHRTHNGIQTHEPQSVPWLLPLNAKFNGETSARNAIRPDQHNDAVPRFNASDHTFGLDYESKSNA